MKPMWAFSLLVAVPVAAAPVPSPKAADEPVSAPAARLLEHRRIQKELKLTGDQRTAIVDGLADIDEAIDKKREKLARIANLNQEDLDKIDKEQAANREKFLISASTKLLNTDSRSRLRQINAQVRGIDAFLDPGVQKLLTLSEAQKKSVTRAVKEQEEKIQA